VEGDGEREGEGRKFSRQGERDLALRGEERRGEETCH
jgi:hypothetical protein